jgi:hypothetical protein
MRHLVLLASLLLVSGCAEIFRGPRVVHYTDTEFYVRSIPLFTSTATAEEIPAEICGRMGKVPQMRDTYQDAWFDIEYTTYKCIEGQPNRPASTSS